MNEKVKLKVEYVKLEELIPFELNARTHSKEQSRTDCQFHRRVRLCKSYSGRCRQYDYCRSWAFDGSKKGRIGNGSDYPPSAS